MVMPMRSNTLTVFLALVAGFAGGILSQHLATPAQAATAAAQVISARDIRLVDSQGSVIAELAPSKTHIWRAQLRITGYDGHFADLGATNLIFGARGGGELGLGYVQDKSGNPTHTAIYIEQLGHPRMAIDAAGPGITLYGKKSALTLYADENGTSKLWSAP